VYLSGADLFAHVATQGPEEARRIYLARALEPLFAKLHRALAERGALDDRFTVLVSDHGHTQVVHDDAHALATSFESDPPAVLARSGLRVRPFALELDEEQEDFQAVLAYQGAMAFVYLADRSTCASPGQRCDWTRPPRYREDVLAVAEAFHRASRAGELVPEMKGVLDLVLARRPRPHHEVDEPFRVYVGDGRLVRLETWLRRHPHPRYVRLAERLADLAAGPRGPVDRRAPEAVERGAAGAGRRSRARPSGAAAGRRPAPGAALRQRRETGAGLPPSVTRRTLGQLEQDLARKELEARRQALGRDARQHRRQREVRDPCTIPVFEQRVQRVRGSADDRGLSEEIGTLGAHHLGGARDR
jgi:hypothetical protein